MKHAASNTDVDDADIIIVAYGICARIAKACRTTGQRTGNQSRLYQADYALALPNRSYK